MSRDKIKIAGAYDTINKLLCDLEEATALVRELEDEIKALSDMLASTAQKAGYKINEACKLMGGSLDILAEGAGMRWSLRI